MGGNRTRSVRAPVKTNFKFIQAARLTKTTTISLKLVRLQPSGGAVDLVAHTVGLGTVRLSLKNRLKDAGYSVLTLDFLVAAKNTVFISAGFVVAHRRRKSDRMYLKSFRSSLSRLLALVPRDRAGSPRRASFPSIEQHNNSLHQPSPALLSCGGVWNASPRTKTKEMQPIYSACRPDDSYEKYIRRA
ncbi:hypothetical protein BC835DRAFT_786973 [Cytidiella melzeri]|nr:hypothetical protein BC835DRAFT_786973 [Cytidiella melzeri]